MKRSCAGRWLLGASLSMAFLSGCQTWVPDACLTLPTPHYLRHLPQYLPPSPPYPLPRELATLEEAAAKQNAQPGQ